MAELIPQLPSQPPPQQPPERPKYNSTSSLFIDSTISRPCIDEIIFCVSIVIHDRIEEGEREVAKDQSLLERIPASFNTQSKPLLVQLDPNDASEDAIFQSIKSIYSIAEFSAECLVISLLYIERVRSITGLHLLMANWQPMLLAAMGKPGTHVLGRRAPSPHPGPSRVHEPRFPPMCARASRWLPKSSY